MPGHPELSTGAGCSQRTVPTVILNRLEVSMTGQDVLGEEAEDGRTRPRSLAGCRAREGEGGWGDPRQAPVCRVNGGSSSASRQPHRPSHTGLPPISVARWPLVPGRCAHHPCVSCLHPRQEVEPGAQQAKVAWHSSDSLANAVSPGLIQR